MSTVHIRVELHDDGTIAVPHAEAMQKWCEKHGLILYFGVATPDMQLEHLAVSIITKPSGADAPDKENDSGQKTQGKPR